MIGSGYHPNAKTPIVAHKFVEVWRDCVQQYASEGLVKIVILAAGDDGSNYTRSSRGVDYINATGDLGHIHDKAQGRNNHFITGWAAGMLATAMLAYNDLCDFIYQEQDCLAFGDYVGELYKDLGEGGACFGRGLRTQPRMRATQSLFIVRHAHIPLFVRDYLSLGEDVNAVQHPRGAFGEIKTAMLHERDIMLYRLCGEWNVDRDRPLPFHLPVFAAQQWTLEEYNEARSRGLL
jgi:hypothetical protein